MLLLASASPRRADLLKAAGIPFDVLAVHVAESRLGDETPDTHVRRLAEAKAREALLRRPGAVALGADTVVVVEGRILGKPRDAADARSMLRSLSGRAHEVWTGVALLSASTAAVDVECTRVWFSALTDDDIDWYVGSGEPMDKAGAYAIQGLASRFIERIDGSYANVVGLPVALVYRLLQKVPEIRRSWAL
jgi:septum formation protein